MRGEEFTNAGFETGEFRIRIRIESNLDALLEFPRPAWVRAWNPMAARWVAGDAV